MAFKPKEKEISQLIQTTNPSVAQPIFSPNEGNYERKKQYQFTLKPSNREKLNQLAMAAGARSASDYLDWLIENQA
ncbi:TPA: hypothetical protein U1B13_000543 [Streptococcus suis]|nr:hypothetical protein [Streptococcus suis]